LFQHRYSRINSETRDHPQEVALGSSGPLKNSALAPEPRCQKWHVLFQNPAMQKKNLESEEWLTPRNTIFKIETSLFSFSQGHGLFHKASSQRGKTQIQLVNAKINNFPT